MNYNMCACSISRYSWKSFERKKLMKVFSKKNQGNIREFGNRKSLGILSFCTNASTYASSSPAKRGKLQIVFLHFSTTRKSVPDIRHAKQFIFSLYVEKTGSYYRYAALLLQVWKMLHILIWKKYIHSYHKCYYVSIIMSVIGYL